MTITDDGGTPADDTDDRSTSDTLVISVNAVDDPEVAIADEYILDVDTDGTDEPDVNLTVPAIAGLLVNDEAADVDDVGGAGEQRHQAPAAEGGRHHGEIVQVAGAFPRIVGDVDVALGHGRGRKRGEKVLDAEGHRVDVAGSAGDGLRQHASTRIEDAGGTQGMGWTFRRAEQDTRCPG